jgi:hypothetical protein
MDLIAKWKTFVEKLNSQGIPLPTLRDPKTKVGSITYTLVVVSACMCVVSVMLMQGTVFAKLKSDFVLNAETANQIHDAFTSSLQFFMACLGAYLGRKMQKDPGGMTVAGKPDVPPDVKL